MLNTRALSLVLCFLVVSQLSAQSPLGRHLQSDWFSSNPSSYPDTAFMIEADDPSRPMIRMKLGSAAGSAFKIFNSSDAALFSVQHDGPTIFSTNGTERMRINPNGGMTLNYVGSHHARLLVQHGADGSTGIFSTHQPVVESTVTQLDSAVYAQMTENVLAGVSNGGYISGLTSSTKLDGLGSLSQAIGALIYTGTAKAGTLHNVFGVKLVSESFPGSTITRGYGVYVQDVLADTDWAFYQASDTDSSYFAGNVVIGGTAVAATGKALHVTGDAHFVGTVTGTNIRAHYQDVAEWVPSDVDLAPGTVVILNPERNNEVMASGTAYDTSVAGVVSAQPGISLGIPGEGMEQVATTGRVKVRVDARAGAIRVGDLLVTSNTPGTAMRSEPMQINGRTFHQPGTIVGKALEPLNGGVGEILVLLSMQ